MSEIIQKQNEFLTSSAPVAKPSSAAMAAADEQNHKLEQERAKFTEAALKLGRERAAFLAEKEAFEKAKLQQQQQQQSNNDENLSSSVMLDEETILNTPDWVREKKRNQPKSTSLKGPVSNLIRAEKKMESPFKSPLFDRYLLQAEEDPEDGDYESKENYNNNTYSYVNETF